MDIDNLRGELERLFELDELLDLSRTVLGLDPDTIGGTSGKGSFSRSLTEHCRRVEAVEALCDALAACKGPVTPALEELRMHGLPTVDEVHPGDQVGPFVILRKLGQGTAAITYLARRGESEVRLKLLRQESARDRRGVHRLMTLTRLVAAVDHPGLPKNVETGELDGRFYVSHDHVETQPLAARIARTGAMHINEAREIALEVCASLAAMHERRLTHGNLKLENVLVVRGSDAGPRVLLVDAGGDRLRARAPANGRMDMLRISAPRTISPEQLRGELPSERSDIYSFGAILYEILTGKPLFGVKTGIDAALAHLTTEPQAPSQVAPRGFVAADIDDFVLALLAKSPDARPKTMGDVLRTLQAIGRPSRAPKAVITEDRLTDLIDTLVQNPESETAALELESAVEAGADVKRVADALCMAADIVDDGSGDPAKRDAKRSLLFRAGRLLQDVKKDMDGAESIYSSIVELDPTDLTAQEKLEDIRRTLGKWEEIVETLLSRAEATDLRVERGRIMARIGRLAETELDDPEQALVAYTQAFCEDPASAAYVDSIERLAKTNGEAWGEVLSTCNGTSTEDRPPEERIPLFITMGRWYAERYARPDLALQCYQAVLVTEPSNDLALTGLTALYRRTQNWRELGTTLLRHAEAEPSPVRARSFRCEAAAILETHLNDSNAARDIYVGVLGDDPGYEAAVEALGRIFAQAGDHAGYVKLLNRQAGALQGSQKHHALCRIAEIQELHLFDDEEARRLYQQVLEENPDSLDALRGLDRLHGKAGRYQDLLSTLESQVRLAATPRQKIGLYERMAGIYEEEFLDHQKTAEALETILELDPAHDASMTNLARHYRALSRWEDLEELLGRHAEIVSDATRQRDLLLARAHVLSSSLGAAERSIEVLERVLALDPEHAGALESLAQLRESAGQQDAALTAIEALAERAETPQGRAEQLLRAARLLAARGERDGAIERYKLALDATPSDSVISQELRGAYLARGDANAAVELCEQELDRTEGDRQKAKLAAEVASIHRVHLSDRDKAEAAAKRALDYDPTNIQALTVLGDLSFEAGHMLEAASYYEKLAGKVEQLGAEEAVRILLAFVDALARTGSTEKALGPMDTLLRLAPGDRVALLRVADVTFQHGSPARAKDLYRTLLEDHGDTLEPSEKALATYRLGESLRRSGALTEAVAALEDAIDLDPQSTLPLVALAAVHTERSDYGAVVDVKTRHLDIATGEERVALLLDVAELASKHLDNRALATKSLVAALDERPDDRKLLMRLMQLYSEDKDWSKLIDVVVKLADFVDDTAQKAKYLHTAAMVAARELADFDAALAFHARVLELDSDNVKSIDETIEVLEQKRDFQGAVDRLQEKAKAASAGRDNARMLEAFTRLAHLYQNELGRIGHAIDALEAAQTLDPDNRERNEKLAELYTTNPGLYLDKAVRAQLAMLAINPYREESYKLLRRLYTEAKRADPAWCLCQALYVLKLAEPDEERFFRRMRSEDPAYAQEVFSEEDWVGTLLHPDADPLVTSLFALIEPAVIATRSRSLEEHGYDPRYAIDPSAHPYPMSQTLYYAAGVMGMECPPTFENVNEPAGLAFLHAYTPAVVLGNAALAAEIPPQAAAFVAGRHLAYYRPGLYMRYLLPNAANLKNWLFAAIRMNAPSFPIAPEIEGLVSEAKEALERHLQPELRDHLSRIVSRLLQSGRSLDLKRWMLGVDASADRVGFVLAHDLETAVEIIRASDESSSSMPPQQRLKELVLFAIGEPYFAMRQRLQITIDN
jgi:tetratricopeptide (TPR) repeat protein